MSAPCNFLWSSLSGSKLFSPPGLLGTEITPRPLPTMLIYVPCCFVRVFLKFRLCSFCVYSLIVRFFLSQGEEILSTSKYSVQKRLLFCSIPPFTLYRFPCYLKEEHSFHKPFINRSGCKVKKQLPLTYTRKLLGFLRAPKQPLLGFSDILLTDASDVLLTEAQNKWRQRQMLMGSSEL